MIDLVTLGLSIAVFIETLWCMRAAYRLSKLYQARLFQSEFFRRLVARNKRVAYIGGGAIALIVVWSLLAWSLPAFVPAIPRPWGTIAIALALMVMLSGPILDERYVQNVRKGGNPNLPPRGGA
jgi:hypothetical protein